MLSKAVTVSGRHLTLLAALISGLWLGMTPSIVSCGWTKVDPAPKDTGAVVPPPQSSSTLSAEDSGIPGHGYWHLVGNLGADTVYLDMVYMDSLVSGSCYRWSGGVPASLSGRVVPSVAGLECVLDEWAQNSGETTASWRMTFRQRGGAVGASGERRPRRSGAAESVMLLTPQQADWLQFDVARLVREVRNPEQGNDEAPSLAVTLRRIRPTNMTFSWLAAALPGYFGRTLAEDLEQEFAAVADKHLGASTEFTALTRVMLNEQGLLVMEHTTFYPIWSAAYENWSQYEIYDLNDRRKLRIDDIFTPGWRPSIHRALDAGLNQLFPDHWEPEFDIPDDFYISRAGLTFVYPRGTILPRTEGAVEITLPWTDISDLINPASPARRLWPT